MCDIISSKMLIKCMILWIAYFVTVSEATPAPFIKPCKPTDSECMLNSARIALPYFAHGVEELGITAIEPLAIKDVKADTGELKMSFRKIKVHNLSKCEFDSITRDPVKSTVSITAHCPLVLNGEYTVGGNLLYLEIEGDGGFEIGGGTLKTTVDLRLKTFNDEEGKKHYKVSGFDFKYEPLDKYDIKFENLFNGDRQKAEPIEKVLSESWKELILDVGRPVLKEGLTRLANIIDKFFHNVPAEYLEIA